MTQLDSDKSTDPLAAELEDARAQIAELKRIVGSYQVLLQRTELHRILSEASVDPVFEFTPNGQYTYANQALAEAFGKPVQNIIGKRIWDFFPKQEADRRFASLSEVFQTGEPKVIEGRVPRADGERYYVTTIMPVRDEDGKVVSALCSSKDITERKRAEEALRESESSVRAVLDATPFPVAIVDLQDDKIQFWSRSALDVFGHTAPTAAQWYQIAYPDPDYRREVIDRWKPFLDVARESRQAVNTGEYQIACADGSERTCELYAFFLPNKLIVTFNDITKRKRAEEALRESEEKYRSLAESSTDYIMRYDQQCRHTYMNQAGLRVSGMAAADLIGKTHRESGFPDDLCHLWEERIMRVFETAEPSQIEFEWTGADGSVVLDLRLTPEFDVKGKVLSVLGVSRDITRRKRAEEEKAKLEAQLHQAQKMDSIGRLAGGVAHDFNNMLGVILGNVEIAIEQLDPSHPLREDLGEIRAAAERSANLTRQLLAFARKQTVAPKVLGLNQTVESMLKMLRRLIGEDVDLVWLPRAGLWPIKVDPSQIDQILANLCVNARDAIGGVGKLTIETANTTLDEDYRASHAEVVPGAYVKLAVSDDGCGMDKATQEKLFEPFFTTKGVGQGTGLGLATVYGIVKQNGGFINVYSEPGQGTTFAIHLPRHVAEKTAQAQSKPPTAPVARGHETILLVEDEPAILKLTRRMLERLGYTVLTASTPGEAIRLADTHVGEIHLLMTDVVMPEMNGRDLAKQLLTSYPGLKRLFMSGYTANVIAHHGVLDEGVHFIQKPFSKQDLSAKVREALERG